MLIGVDASRVTRARLTGTENYSLQVLRALLARDVENQYRLYFNQAPTAGLLPIGPRIETCELHLPRLWTHLALGREMVVRPPDVLFVPSHVLPLTAPMRSVAVVYDVGHRYFPRAHRVQEWLYVEWAIRRHVRIASAIITISESSKRDLVRLYGARPERIAVAYPAVDQHFRPMPSAEVQRVRERYRVQRPYVLHVSTIKPRKNLPRLVEAFARADLPSETVLVLVGGRTFGAEAVELAVDRAGLRHRVRWLDYVEGADLPALYSGARCVALVSLHEGFGMTALEALACGAPLVASNRSSLPEFVGDAAVQVDPLDVQSITRGLESACSDGRLREDLQERGPCRAAEYTWANAAAVTLSVLNSVGMSAT